MALTSSRFIARFSRLIDAQTTVRITCLRTGAFSGQIIAPVVSPVIDAIIGLRTTWLTDQRGLARQRRGPPPQSAAANGHSPRVTRSGDPAPGSVASGSLAPVQVATARHQLPPHP